ncbi:MAG: GGDEF domain-containing protein [Candidatus Micrarchaeia archaeon]
MTDKPRHLAGLLSDAGFVRTAKALDFGRRLLEKEPEWAKGYEDAVLVFRELVHRSGTADRLMHLIPQIDSRIRRVELWEAKKDGLRFLNSDPEAEFGKRPFIKYGSDARAANMRMGNIIVFNGTKSIIFSTNPGDYAVKGLMAGATFGENGCWIPLGNIVNGRMELTHVLAVYGDISQEPGKENHQLNFIVSVAALIHTVMYSQRVIDRGDTDPTTTLWNRRRFDDDILLAAAGHAIHDRKLSIVMMDLDHFKLINDNNGHVAGDMVLGIVGSMFKRSGELAYRYGGEEFIQLQKDIGGMVSLRRLEEMHAAFNPLECRVEHVGAIPVTASFGAASAGIIRLLLERVERYPKSSEAIISLVSKIRSLEPRAMEDAKRIREAEEAARRAGVGIKLDKIPEGSLLRYIEAEAELMVRLADGAMYHTKEAGRNSVSRAIVHGNELVFERVDFTQLEPSAPSGVADGQLPLSLPNRQSFHP